MIIKTQSEHLSSLLSNEDHYDTVLVGSDKVQVQVHSYLLARCSQVMSDLLIEHRSHHNSHPVTIIVQDMEVDDIRHILQLLLTGEVHIEEERMEKFLENTKLFGLTNVCESFAMASEGKDHYSESNHAFDDDDDDGDEEEDEDVDFKPNLKMEGLDLENDVHIKESDKIKSEEGTTQMIQFLKQPKNDKVLRGKRKRWKKDDVMNSKICPECKKEYSTPKHMRIHFKREHDEEGRKSFQVEQICNICGSKHRNAASLRQHLKWVHGEKKFSCDKCGFVTRRREALSVHISSIHENERLFCDQCNASFISKRGLNQHIKTIHENTEKYKCSECEFESRHKAHLQTHFNRIHLKQRYNCDVCSAEYSCRYNFSQHMLKKHSIDVRKHKVHSILLDQRVKVKKM